ncbi:hypothetical protein EP7_004069 [Isosphaeraceae bacterium EP7]
MPDPVVLSPGRLKWAAVGLLFILLTGVGVWIGMTGDKFGWWIAAFFGLGILLTVVVLLPGAIYLNLTDEDFTMCTLYRYHT